MFCRDRVYARQTRQMRLYPGLSEKQVKKSKVQFVERIIVKKFLFHIFTTKPYDYTIKPLAMKKLFFLLTITGMLGFSCSNTNDKMLNALLLTGNDHPAHKWQETTPVIKNIFEQDSLAAISVTENPEDLAGLSKKQYDFLILNYCNWEDPQPLSEKAKAGLLSYLEEGGGLIILHFSNGAFHFSLPGAGQSDWPEYRGIVHQVWDHHGASTHDPYGDFRVEMTGVDHFITRNLSGFETKDELYYNQVGETELTALFTAVSAQSGKAEPLAWAYSYKNARVFQTLLGHGPESYQPKEYQEILRRAAKWVTN